MVIEKSDASVIVDKICQGITDELNSPLHDNSSYKISANKIKRGRTIEQT